MQTEDGAVRVEVVRHRRTDWYRIIRDGETYDHLSIATVERLLREAGVDLGDLKPVDDEAARYFG